MPGHILQIVHLQIFLRGHEPRDVPEVPDPPRWPTAAKDNSGSDHTEYRRHSLPTVQEGGLGGDQSHV